jgi:hypothetical protein
MTTLDIAHKDRAHSAVGGSTAKRVMNCTASVQHCAKYPNTSSPFAEMGTALHEAIDLIFQGKTREDRDVIGLMFNNHLITEELFDEAIAPALAAWDALEKELGGIEYFNEKRVVFPDIDGAYGTVDIVGSAKDRSIVWDWKFGRGVAVTAEENEQLMYYAYAAAHTHPTDKFFDRDKPIELFICQPMVNNGAPFTRWTTSWLQLEAFALELKRAVDISQTPDATFKMGPWCKFCQGKVGCPEYNGVVQTLGTITRAETETELVKWLPYADLMIEWGENVKNAAHALLEQGGKVPGYKLVQKRATRSWADEESALSFLAEAGISPEVREVKKVISPAQAEKVLKAVGVTAIPDALIDKKSSGTVLAPESDKRPALTVAPDAMRQLADRLAAM